MYFSKISLRRKKESLRGLNDFVQKDGYYFHQLIWALFSENNPDKTRDFLYHLTSVHHWPCFYTVSKTPPVDDDNLWDIQCKPYFPRIRNADRLHFRLRANPRICRRKENGKKYYVDAIQNAWHEQAAAIQSHDITKNEVVQQTGERWLTRKGEQHGFQLDGLIAENFQKHRFRKKSHTVSYSTLDFMGQLMVTDAQLFMETLFTGIGSAKGFGCGLLMVKY